MTQPTPPEHEHKSEFQSFAADVRTAWEKLGLPILVTILAVLIFVLATRWLTGRQERRWEAASSALAAAENPFAMQDVADRFNHLPELAGYARLQAASQTLREGLGLLDVPGNVKTSQADRDKRVEQSVVLFQRVIDSGASPLQVLNARLGLAAALETQQKFEDASRQYDTVESDAADRWPVIAARAKSRRQSIDRIKAPVTFPAPKPKAEQTEGDSDLIPGVLPAPELDLDLFNPPELPEPPTSDTPAVPEP